MRQERNKEKILWSVCLCLKGWSRGTENTRKSINRRQKRNNDRPTTEDWIVSKMIKINTKYTTI